MPTATRGTRSTPTTGLQRLTSALRGTYNTGTGAIDSRNFEQAWTLDQLGNWAEFKERDTDVGATWDLDQDRTHNAVNEITDVTVWSDPTYDLAGNTTTSNNGLAMKYDAWNRLVGPASSFVVYEYDGLGRRIVTDLPATGWIDYDFYYNDEWQVIEERKAASANSLAQYVWHPYYIDALAVRYYDADTDGNLAELSDGAHYYCQDANYNVTAITNASGTVLERYSYTPYGKAIVLDADFALDANNTSDIGNNYLFTGRETNSESSLQINRHRYYDPRLGRWVTRDPIEYEGSEWNLYEYLASSSVNYSDPHGLQNAVRPWPGGGGTRTRPGLPGGRTDPSWPGRRPPGQGGRPGGGPSWPERDPGMPGTGMPGIGGVPPHPGYGCLPAHLCHFSEDPVVDYHARCDFWMANRNQRPPRDTRYDDIFDEVEDKHKRRPKVKCTTKARDWGVGTPCYDKIFPGYGQDEDEAKDAAEKACQDAGCHAPGRGGNCGHTTCHRLP